MYKLLYLLMLIGAMLPGAARAAGTAPPAAPVLHLANGRWFDGEGFVDATWYAVGSRLTRSKPARIDLRVDLGGRYVIPPLAEAHNHDMQNAFLAARSARRYLRAGIFYSAQLCAQPEQVRGFRGFTGQPNAVDVLFTAACITSSDGHPLGIALRMDGAAGHPTSAADYHDQAFLVVDTVDDLDARWQRIVEAPAGPVKLILLNSEDHAVNRGRSELYGFNGLDPGLVPDIIDRVHQAGRRVVAHVDSAHDFRVAVESGADVIAHLPGYRFADGKSAADYRIADEVIGEAARRQVAVIATAVAARSFMQRKPELADALRTVQRDNLQRLVAGRVPLAIGSDLVASGSVLDEIEYLDGLDVLPRATLLRLATRDTPRLLIPGRAIGRFDEGHEASLLVLDGNPLEDLSALRRVWLRVKQGSLLRAEPQPVD